MIRTSLFFLFVFPFVISMNGQSVDWSFDGNYGIGLANIRNHTTIGDRFNVIFTNSISLNNNLTVNDKFEFTIGLLIDQRGGVVSTFDRVITNFIPPDVFVIGDTVQTVRTSKFTYLTIPIVASRVFNFGEKYKLTIGGGAYYARLIEQQWQWEKSPDSRSKYIEENVIQSRYMNNDGGLIAKLKFNYQINDLIELNLACSYLHGLTNFIPAATNTSKAYHQRSFLETGIKINVL